MTDFSRTWNTAYEGQPADDEDISAGAGRIRNLKVDIHERLIVDHSWAGDGNDGYHTVVTLLVANADPATLASAGHLYTKTISSNVELFYQDAAGNVIQFTKLGEMASTTFETLTVSGVTVLNGEVIANTGNMFILAPAGIEGRLHISSDAGTSAWVGLESAQSQRWLIGKNNVPESGSNLGSDFDIVAFSDTGVALGIRARIGRADGVLQLFAIPTSAPAKPSALWSDGGTLKITPP